MGVIVLAAIPYGPVEPWWKALFQCLIFGLAALSLIAQIFGGEHRRLDQPTRAVFLPLLALLVFALIQMVAWSNTTVPGIGQVGKAISVDAFQTWLFVIHLTALVLLGWLLILHTTTARRLRLLVQLILLIGLSSALFGMWRKASQHEVGFILPYLRPAVGYAEHSWISHAGVNEDKCVIDELVRLPAMSFEQRPVSLFLVEDSLPHDSDFPLSIPHLPR